MYSPNGLAVDAASNVLFADTFDSRVRRVSPSGIITTFAGTDVRGFSGDGGPATAAQLDSPYAAAVDAGGNILIADTGNYRVRRVSPSGIITTVAGTGVAGFSGDGGPATAAQLSGVTDIKADAAGNILIADYGNYRVRRVDTNGVITTVAGNGVVGFSGDGGPATAAQLRSPNGVAVDAAGNILIVDRLDQRVRRVDTSGVITTVAGNGVVGFSGDGGPATAAQLYGPWAIAVDPAGNILIADNNNARVRRVDTNGVITTVAGNGVVGFSGDGGPATAAQLGYPARVAVDAAGNLFISDAGNRRVRKVTPPSAFAGIEPSWRGPAKALTTIADPVNSATGAFVHSESDLTPPAGVQGLDIVRWYNSTDPGSSVHGVGWRSAWSETLLTDAAGGYSYSEATGRVTSFTSAVGGGWAHPVGVDAVLALRADGSPSLTFTTGEVVEFDLSGRLEQRTFPDGQVITVTRQATGEPITVTSSAGASVTLAYVSSPGGVRLSSVTGSWGQPVSYSYDTAGIFTSVTRPGGVVTSYTNDPTSGLLTAVTDASGVREVFNAYNANRQVVSQTAASGAVTTFAYNAAALSTTVHDPVTNTDLTYVHDASGRVVSITDPYGKIVTRSWDGQSNALGAVNRNGTAVANTFDASNNLLTSTDPKTGTTTYTYDTSNRVKTVLDPAGNTTTYGYTGTDRIPSSVMDPMGNTATRVIAGGLVMSTTDADLVTTSYAYTGRQVASVTDGLGNLTSYTYDTAGRRTKTTLPSGKFSTTAYDGANRVTSQTGFDGGVTVYTYDLAGRVATVTDPTLAVTSNTYDTAGRLATSTAANGAVSTYTYDGDDQLVSTLLPGGATTSQTYGPLGRVLTETDEVGRVTAYEYDVAGNQTKVTAPDGGVTVTAYDAQGRVSSQTDPASRVSTTTFDTAGRVATEVAPGSLTMSYTYDVLGRRKTVTDVRGGVTTIGYTPGGRLQSSTSPANLVTSYTYDLAGRLKSQVEPPNLTTRIGYDVDSNKISVTDPAGLVTGFTYDPARRVATVTDPANVVTTNTWSLRGELLTTKTGAQNPAVYVYNPDRTLKTATDPNGYATSFAYDALGRRTSRTGPDGGIDAWTYDNSGQLLTSKDAANRQTTYTYDPAGRVATVLDPSGRKTTTAYNLDGTVKTVAVLNGTTYTYGYDTAGRVSTVTDTSAAVWAYGYEAGGQVAKYTTPAGRTTAWSYDAAGRRTQLAYPDGATYTYAYDTAGRVASITPGEVVADTFTGPTNSAPDTAKWTATLTSGGTAKVVGNELELGYTTTASSTASVAATGVSLADSDVKVRYRFTNTTTANAGLLRVYARQVAGTTGGNYRVEINTSTATATLFRTKGTVTTSIGTFTVPISTTAQVVRFQVKGSLVSARVWADGTTEPAAWSKSVTDTQVTAAGTSRLEVTRSAGTGKVYLDNVTVSNPTTPPAAVAGYGYNNDSQTTVETLTGGTRTRTFTTGRLTSFNETLPGLTRATALTYDTTGRIATEATAGITTTYGYDPAGQLLSTTPSTGTATVYTYDKLGRRATTKTGTAAAVTNTYDATGALLTAGPTTFTYDAAGRRLTETAAGNTLTYTYNPAGQLNTLKRVQGTVTTTQTRTYDAAGMMATVANVTGATTTLDWDPTGGVAHLLGMTVAGTTDIVQGVAGLVGSKVGATSAAYGLDQNGSVITGTQARSTGYTAFGDPTTASTFEPRLGYRGELTFDSLAYLRARDYQAVTGGFTSADPVPGRAGTTTLNNRYHYVDNKPLQRIDPTGLYSQRDSTTDVRPMFNSALMAVGVDALTEAGVDATFWELVAGLGSTEVVATGGIAGLGTAGTAGVAVAGGVALGYGIYKLNPGGYADKIENSCANGGAWCPTNALPPPAKGIFNWAAEQTLGWSFLDDDPAPSPKPQPAAAGAGSRGGNRPCSVTNGGGILERPHVDDPKLQNYVDNLYKGTTNPGRTGTGTTADAVRNERRTGQPTGGSFHTIKAQETVSGLQKWLRKNQNASAQERVIAQSLLDDLLDALNCAP
jgi:RHS repeat-associated protein